MPEDRRLAAIMFTDIVGYTTLMGSYEEKSQSALQKISTPKNLILRSSDYPK